jgi:hypothetical protein
MPRVGCKIKKDGFLPLENYSFSEAFAESAIAVKSQMINL